MHAGCAMNFSGNVFWGAGSPKGWICDRTRLILILLEFDLLLQMRADGDGELCCKNREGLEQGEVLMSQGMVFRGGLEEIRCLEEFQITVANGVCLECQDHQWREGFDPVPLHSLPPNADLDLKFSSWFIKKVKEIEECVGNSCEGFEEQFQALLIAIESNRLSATKSASKRDRS